MHLYWYVTVNDRIYVLGIIAFCVLLLIIPILRRYRNPAVVALLGGERAWKFTVYFIPIFMILWCSVMIVLTP